MSRYMLRFKVDTCLSTAEDLTLEFEGHYSTFLFSQKTKEQSHVIAQIEVEAPNNRAAWAEAADSTLPLILDALSFSTGTPLLLRDCEVVLKDESGSLTRKAIYVGQRHLPSVVGLGPDAIDDAKQILATGNALRLPLCWHRYALDRQLALEQFVFNWLAFEGLAGGADVLTRCQKCGAEVEHCGIPISHRSSNKQAAKQIFQAAHPETTDRQFNRDIWGDARNDVFHGRKYPDPKHLNEINKISRALHSAVDKEIEKLLLKAPRYRAHQQYQTWFRVFLFCEWETKCELNQRFADDWPIALLAKMAAEPQPGEAYREAERAGLKISFDYERESADW